MLPTDEFQVLQLWFAHKKYPPWPTDWEREQKEENIAKEIAVISLEITVAYNLIQTSIILYPYDDDVSQLANPYPLCAAINSDAQLD